MRALIEFARCGWMVSLLLGLVFLPTLTGRAAPSSLLPAAAKVVPGPETPAASDSADGLLLRGDLAKVPDRLLWDIPFEGRLQDGARSLVLVYSVPVRQQAARGLSLHLKTPRGWFAYPEPLPLAKEGHATMPLARFQPEGTVKGLPQDAEALRISLWKTDGDDSAGETTVALRRLTSTSSRIGVVQSTAATAGGEAGVAALCARRCEKALQKAGLGCDVIDDSLDPETLKGFSVLFLPYSPRLDPSRTRRLLSYLSHGGKLFVFYNPSRPLASRFGIEPPLWKGSPETRPWTAFLMADAIRGGDQGKVRAIPHFTENLLPPRPTAPGKAKVVANWLSADGSPSRIPACVLSSSGAWFAHLPPLPFPETARLYRALLQELSPDLLEGTAGPILHEPPLTRTPSPPDELRAVWIAVPVARHAGGWDGLFGEWAGRHAINTVFLHCNPLVKEGARGSSRGYLPAVLKAAGDHGLSVHGWMTCWTTTGLAPSTRARLEKEGRLLRGSDGAVRDWLCPDDPRNRSEVRQWAEKLASLGVSGLHLDYMRYPGDGCCYCRTTREAFEKSIGETVSDWPREVLPGGTRREAFLSFRSASLTSWLSDLRSSLVKSHPGLLLSVAVLGSAQGARSLGQDVGRWCKDGLVDFIVPMAYTEDQAAFVEQIDGFLSSPDIPVSRLVIGIGTGADESQLDAGQTAWQIEAVRAKGCRGHSFFQDDASLRGILTEMAP